VNSEASCSEKGLDDDAYEYKDWPKPKKKPTEPAEFHVFLSLDVTPNPIRHPKFFYKVIE